MCSIGMCHGSHAPTGISSESSFAELLLPRLEEGVPLTLMVLLPLPLWLSETLSAICCDLVRCFLETLLHQLHHYRSQKVWVVNLMYLAKQGTSGRPWGQVVGHIPSISFSLLMYFQSVLLWPVIFYLLYSWWSLSNQVHAGRWPACLVS